MIEHTHPVCSILLPPPTVGYPDITPVRERRLLGTSLPEGKKFRSRAEVVRHYGLNPVNKRNTSGAVAGSTGRQFGGGGGGSGGGFITRAPNKAPKMYQHTTGA